MKFEEVEIKQSRYPAVMRFRCSNEDYDLVKQRAAATGCSLSVYLRKRATGGRVSQPIQDMDDLNQIRQHMGLLKQLVTQNADVRPLLQDIEDLVTLMTKRVKQ